MLPVKTFELSAPGYLEMLAWRIVNWPAETANRSKFTSAKAETIMKTLVSYNAGVNATTGNGRKRTGTITGLSVQADGANGNTLDWNCHGKVVLENLQDLARVSGGDFDLVKTAAASWEFRWYTGQLGADRTATVTFAVENGSMGEPESDYSRLDERTVACVWGQGEEADRDYVTRTGADYAAGNDKEIYVDAKDVTKGSTAGLNAKGDVKLDETRAREIFTFKVLQTPSLRYGAEYFLGDLVAARNPFTGASLTKKVIAVTLGLQSSGEKSIDIELSDP
jgi:hypothetical protein